MNSDTAPTPQLGDEMPAPDGRTLRVVAVQRGALVARYGDGVMCNVCALHPVRLGLCNLGGGDHPFHCRVTRGAQCAVFVDDIPVLAMKGILA